MKFVFWQATAIP